MSSRPKAVTFDVIETVFSLESLRDRLAAVGLSREALDIWFARILRDGFALEVTDTFQPFRDVASAALMSLIVEHGARADRSAVQKVIDGFAELDPHPDAHAAFERLQAGGIRQFTLTNGSAEVTKTLLRRAGFDRFIEQVISIDEVHHWKPSREIYLHAARRAAVEPGELALVAAHAWDTHGAGRAGLTTAFVARGRPFPEAMMAPDVIAASLLEAAEALVDLPQARVSPPGAGGV